jgi:fatty-acyl-CoA synthase
MSIDATFRTLTEALQAAPADHPFVTYWVDEDEQEMVTFGEFRRQARIQAGVLRRHGVMAGDRVVIIMPQSIAAMTAFAGAMLLNTVPAFIAYPNFKIDPGKYRSGLMGVTANLRAKAVVVDQAFPGEMLSCVNCEGAVLVRAEASDDEYTENSNSDPAGLAFIQHSAGTTGLQKGVALTHRAVLRHIEVLRHVLQVRHESDRVYSWLPLYHDMGLIACFMLPMVCHIPVVMQSPLDWVMHPDSMLEIIADQKCTLTWLPNFAFQFVARRIPPAQRSQYDLSSMRAFMNCSEPVRSASMDEFQSAFSSARLKPSALQSSYAMAENVFAVSQSDVASTPARIFADAATFRAEHRVVLAANGAAALCFVSSGSLLPGNEVRVLSDSGEILSDGSVGEIAIRSDTLFNGYYNRPDLTAGAIVDGWYHTGDLGFTLGSELYVVGRRKDLLIVGGENLYPQDIEEVISGHAAIHDGRVVAIGVYNPDLGTEDVIVVAEVQNECLMDRSAEIEHELRKQVIAGTGVAVKTIVLKPPKWIVKSTAGKPARASTREKLLREHPELGVEP